MKYFVSILILSAFASLGHAQMTKEPPQIKLPPGRGAHATAAPKMTPADSAKFAAAFKELYPALKPVPGMRERTEQTLARMARTMKARGVDSAVAYDSVMKKLDEHMDEKILFEVYSKEFSADEIKSLASFFKTPVGKHYLEVEGQVSGAGTQISSYIQRTIMSVTQPMMKPIERPAGGRGGPGGGVPGGIAPAAPRVPRQMPNMPQMPNNRAPRGGADSAGHEMPK